MILSVGQGSNPFPALCVNCLSPVALFRTRDLQPVSLEGYRRSGQRVRWLHSIPRHEFEQTLGDTGVAKTHTQHHHLHMLLTFNFLKILLFSKFLSFIHRYLQGSFTLLSLRKSPHQSSSLSSLFPHDIFNFLFLSRSPSLLLLTPTPPATYLQGWQLTKSPLPQEPNSGRFYLGHRTMGVT